MRVLFALQLVVLAVWAQPVELGWHLPNGTWISVQQVEQLADTPTQVGFFLYTQANSQTAQHIVANDASIQSSHFKAARATKFVIHGWKGSYKDEMNKWITQAWLKRGDFNIIVVDWAASRTENYVSAAKAVGNAGAAVGQMILHLHEQHQMPLHNLDVIGHSLGAHVAGFAGKTVAQSGQQVHTIVGLDAAMPLFSYSKPAKRLASTDAHYVESIQTNGGKLGFVKPIGKGTFYPNGGKEQPGCGSDLDGLCAHTRSVVYYVEAVQQDNFGSIKCSDYEAAVAQECGSTFSSVRMGAVTNAYMVNGDFYVPLHTEAPYGVLEH
ncbi:phospholipase A1 VesT1.02-like [Drosophila busckii]|uniref:phospholipase A1 VesT1.02-like n=1 Tax=Drosophila busckii TaxID=30019 RepID=UPI00083EE36E|nr:phospholipase A1 VesT1.02-like [Drosophila busckii]